MVFAESARYVAKWDLVFAGAEFPQRLLTLGRAIGRRSEQVGLCPHGVLGGVLRMINHNNGRGHAAEYARRLSESSAGTEQTERCNCDLHDDNDPCLGDTPLAGDAVSFEGVGFQRTDKIWRRLLLVERAIPIPKRSGPRFELEGLWSHKEQVFAHMWKGAKTLR